MKKVIFVWVSIFVLQVLVSSCIFFCPCGGCGNSPEQRMNILSWTVNTVNEKYDPVDSATPYPYEQVFKILSIGDRQIVQSKGENKGTLWATAYACSPAPIQANQTFTSIQIVSAIETSYADSNDIITIGEDITDRFVIGYGYSSNFQSIQSFLDDIVIYDGDQYLIRMDQKPAQLTSLSFHIIITLSNGGIFELNDQMLVVT